MKKFNLSNLVRSQIITFNFLIISIISFGQSYQKQIDSLEALKTEYVKQENFKEAQKQKELILKYQALEQAVQNENFKLADNIKASLYNNSDSNQFKAKITVLGNELLNNQTSVDPVQINQLNNVSYFLTVEGVTRKINSNDTLEFNIIKPHGIVKLTRVAGIVENQLEYNLLQNENLFLLINKTVASFTSNPVPYIDIISQKKFNQKSHFKKYGNSDIQRTSERSNSFLMVEKLSGSRSLWVDGQNKNIVVKKNDLISISLLNDKKTTLVFKKVKNDNPAFEDILLKIENILIEPGKSYKLSFENKGASKTFINFEEINIDDINKNKLNLITIP